MGRALFRASHLGAALEYAEGPINLLRPTVVGFNANATPTALEFPVWQATAGLVFKMAHSRWYGWANLVSLFFFAAALWPFFQIAKHLAGERTAWWALIFFMAEPLIAVMAGEATADGFCLAVMLWFVFFADQMIRTGKALWWLPTAFCAALAAVSKLPFFMAAGLYTVFLLMLTARSNWRLWVLLAGAGLVAAGTVAAWTHYCDSLAAQAEYPYAELRLSRSPAIVYWWFGDLHYRLQPGPWIKGGWRFLHATLGCLPLSALLIVGLIRPANLLPKLWLLATFLTTLVFTHVILVHWHYYLMCCPAVALICGATIASWEDLWLRNTTWPRLSLAIAGGALVLTTLDGIISMKIAVDYDQFPSRIASVIREQTKPEDKLIVYSENRVWGGEELFRCGRKGFYVQAMDDSKADPMVRGLRDLLGSEGDLNHLKSQGYNKLVLISESPVRFAVEAVNPGSDRVRHLFPARISPTVDSWAVDFRSDDVLIKEIP